MLDLLDSASELADLAPVEPPPPQSLLEFCIEHWPTIEPGVQLISDDAFACMCRFLERWYRGDFARGVMNVPPGCSKSTLTSVMYPAWAWAQHPGRKFLVASYDQALVLRDAARMATILDSPAYQGRYQTRLRRGARAVGRLHTEQRGWRFSTTPAGAAIGWHFHDGIVDDPIKPQDVLERRIDAPALAKVMTWHDKVVPTRCGLTGQVRTMLIMQRLLEHDLAGECLKREGYEALVLPMRYDARIARGDYRTEPGELLVPKLYPEPRVRALEITLGEDASAQLQQDPIPRTGGLLDEAWLRWEWVDLPYHGQWLQTWDLSGKGTDATRHSAVHGALWCVHRTGRVRELTDTIDERERRGTAAGEFRSVPEHDRYHLVDEVWGVWPFEETLRQLVAAQQRPHWHRAMVKRIEEKASGVQAIQLLTSGWRDASGTVHRIAGIVPTHPKDDKLVRFRPLVPPAAEAGLILLPPWRRTERAPGQQDGVGPDAFRKELLAFPRGQRDDRCDTTSDALAAFTERHIGAADAIRRAHERAMSGI